VSENDAGSRSIWDLDTLVSFTVVFNLALLGLIIAGIGVVNLVEGGGPVVSGVLFLVVGLLVEGAVAAKVIKSRRAWAQTDSRNSRTPTKTPD